jgi:hypothetical protein
MYSYERSRNVLYSSRFLPLYYTRNWFIADRRRDAQVGVMITIIYFYFLREERVLNWVKYATTMETRTEKTILRRKRTHRRRAYAEKSPQNQSK